MTVPLMMAAVLAPVYEGYFDYAGCDKLYGWAWDKNLPNSPINVDILDGNTLLQTVTAGDFRSDLPGNRNHAFNYITPASLKDGRTHTIYVRFSGTSTYLTNSPKSLTCAPPAPTISGYSWNSTPTANQPFGGTITGTNFVSGTRVFFCINGSSTCYEHPSAGISVNSSTSLGVSNVNLSTGSYQVYVQTSGGQSGRSAGFTVQSAPVPPTISGYSWNTVPAANQPFGGTITGSGFASGTRVFFCVNGTSTCYEHPSAGITVNSSTSLSVSNVNLGSGSYQIYVQTSAGQSSRSTAFTVQTPVPTITNYSWNSTPTANQPFNGTITGTGFISGTRVFFCVNGTSTCYEHPSVGIAVNNSTSLNVSNVNLGSGSYQIYVQTSAGQSARSSAFSVQATGPTISGYSWNTTPTANQPFSGTITGTGFISGTRVFFCVSGTGTCYEHSSVGVTLNGLISLSVSNVNLGSGSWQVYVQTSAGQSARSDAFTVQSPPAAPVINSISPASPASSGVDHNVTVSGGNFQQGLTVSITFPGGGGTVLSGAQIQNVTPTSFTMVATLSSAGAWTIRVNNPGGLSSNTFGFTVTATESERAAFVSETIPDGTRVVPGQSFTKTWTVRNSGTTTWNSGYRLRWVNGASLSNHADVPISGSVPPAATYTFSVPMTAPASGSHREDWKLVNGSGTTIQVGSSSTIWVSILVSGGTDAATFVGETIPDGSAIAAGQSFTKSWTIRNSGTTTWKPGYKLRWISSTGANLSARGDIFVNREVGLGGSYTFSVLMTAPTTAGSFREDWQLVNPHGTTIRVGVSQTVWASINVGGAAQTQCGTAAQMRTRIRQRIQANSYLPNYQPANSDIEGLLSLNFPAYEELYHSALRYRAHVQTTFLLAGKFIDQGNLENACSYMRRAERLFSLRTQLEDAAVLVWDTRVSGAQEVVAEIISQLCKIETYLVKAQFGATAASLAEGACLYVDFAVDKSIYGEDEAIRRLRGSFRDAVIGVVLNQGLDDLGGRTLSQWMSSGGFRYDTHQSLLNNYLRKVLQTPATKVKLRNALAELVQGGAVDLLTDKVIGNFLDGLSGALNSTPQAVDAVHTNILSGPAAAVEQQVEDAPLVQSTSPTRSAAFVNINTTSIQVGFSEPVHAGNLSITMIDSSGHTVSLNSIAVNNNLLTATVVNQLRFRNAYTVTVRSGAVRNAAGVPNEEYQWKFVTAAPPLSIGSNVKVVNTGGAGLALRSSARFLSDGSNVISILPEETRLRIIGGPEQSDGYMWWNVALNGQSGWTPMAEWLVPNDQLGIRIGTQAVVSNTGGAGLPLRNEPGVSADNIMTLAEGTRMTVVSGPYLVDGYIWWNLQGEADSGFSATANWLLPDVASTGNTNTLTATATTPSDTDNISVEINSFDVNGLGAGVTRFTRNYGSNTVVTLTAPLTAGEGRFQKWLRDSADWSLDPTTSVTMDTNHTMTAVYVAPAIAVQFSNVGNIFSEGEGRAVVTVTRVGDSAGAATVDYKTVDADTFTVGCADVINNQGAAYARCDFATTVGKVHFAAAETQKQISVPIVDDGQAEGAETFQIVLMNATGATLGTQNTATVTITDNDVTGIPNPLIASTPFFVRQQYLDFLSREPDVSGLNAWLGVLNSCANIFTGPEMQSGCDRIFVSGEGFFRSQEFQLKGFYVFRFYKVAFSRLPEYLEVVTDMSFVAGQTAEEVYARKAQLATLITQRQEFINTYGALTNAQYVNTLLSHYGLQQISTPDPAQPDGTAKVILTATEMINRLNTNTLSRAQVLRAIADSDAVGTQEFNNTFVAMQYYGYLRRKPETAGYEAWLRVLQSGGIRTMVNGFLNSTEYRLRFGQQ